MGLAFRAARLPRDDDRCGWWQLIPAPDPARRLEGEALADFAVVGAGLSGLAAARRLAELRPDARVVVLEAQRAGFGASGRNSGFVGDLAHRDPAASQEEVLRAKRLCRFGMQQLGALVREHGIECEWSERGRIHAAVESHSLRSLEALISVLEASHEPHAVLEREALERAIGTRHYARGVHVASTILLQPAALVRGLAKALPANVDLFEESPVVEMRGGVGWELRTRSGSLLAPVVIAALNGLAPSLGLLGHRIFPLHTFASLTRELRPEERAALGGSAEWGLVSEDRMGTTLRSTQSARLLVRNHQVYAPSLRVGASEFERARVFHRRSIARRWPSLSDVEIEHTWTGVLGVTMNQGCFFGRVADGLFAWAGCNGTGVALGTALGTLLADHALGERPELLRDAFSLRKPAWLPHAPLLGIGVRATLRLLGSRAGQER